MPLSLVSECTCADTPKTKQTNKQTKTCLPYLIDLPNISLVEVFHGHCVLPEIPVYSFRLVQPCVDFEGTDRTRGC